jgi:hypothetical protein
MDSLKGGGMGVVLANSAALKLPLYKFRAEVSAPAEHSDAAPVRSDVT